METLLARITARRVTAVSFCETCGQVCELACRSAAHIDRVTTAAYHARLWPPSSAPDTHDRTDKEPS